MKFFFLQHALECCYFLLEEGIEMAQCTTNDSQKMNRKTKKPANKKPKRLRRLRKANQN
jgi:hypothetical protein